MKDSCRSDRELAKALGVSQPTVSRAKAKLEKEGVILAYTIIPNFNKIGYHIFALTFFTWNTDVDLSERQRAIEWGVKKASSVADNIILIERGIGLGHDSFIASFHKDYSSYAKFLNDAKKIHYVNPAQVESFIVNLDDKVHYRYLTFSTLAKHMLETNQKQE
jgi:DNA-binding Lrp family transcriptional regulator